MDDFWDTTLGDLFLNFVGIVFGVGIVLAIFYVVFKYEDIWDWFKSFFE